jgi:uncharacterized protein YeaO (DUF488 family)
MIGIKRVYEPPSASDGYRVLVDGLWPRGLTREAAAIDDWKKSLAPSRDLRTWFDHQAERWPEFQRRYRAELAAPEAAAELRRLQEIAARGPLTLVYAARSETENNARVIWELLSCSESA